MIICPNCGRENADHYKFCLGCGTELKGGASAKAAVPAPKLGRPGRKLRLDSPLFGGKKSPGGLSGLSGLSRRLGGTTDDSGSDDASIDDSAADDAPGESAETPRDASLDAGASSIEADDVAASDDGFDDVAFEDDAFDADDDDFDGDALDGDPDAFEPDDLDAEPVEARETAASHAVASPVDRRPPSAAELGRIGTGPGDDFDDIDALDDSDDFDDLGGLDDAAAAPAQASPVPRAVALAQPAPVAQPAPIAKPAPVVKPAPVAKPVAQPKPIAQPAPLAQPAASAPLVDPSPPVSAPPAAQGRVCHACGAVVPQGFKFCGVCGTRYDAPPVESPAAAVGGGVAQPVGAPSAHLVLIHPDGTEGEIFPLGAGETTVGRAHPSSIFAEDPFLSPRHATFYFVQGQLYVRDEGSLNGVFLRIRAEVELFHYDMFRIGQQLLRFEEMTQVRPIMPGAGDGTTVMGSPVRGTWGRLASVVALETVTSVWAMRKPEIFLGRERGDLVFPEDGFVSGSHCKLAVRRGRYFLGDLDSTNGTYLRIKGEGIVTRGDLLLLGQQLFKVELNR